jgi:hypothetical protein
VIASGVTLHLMTERFDVIHRDTGRDCGPKDVVLAAPQGSRQLLVLAPDAPFARD